VREPEDDKFCRTNSCHTNLDDHSSFENIKRRHRFTQSYGNIKCMFGFNALKSSLRQSVERKFSIIACTFTHVLASLGSNTKPSVAFLVLSSTILKKRRTLIYRHSLSLPARVRAPQTSVPFPVKDLITLTDKPAFTSTFKAACSLLVILTAGRLPMQG